MAQFEFLAKDIYGKNFRGTLFASSEQTAYYGLQKQGYIVLSVSERIFKPHKAVQQPVTLDDVVIFSKLFTSLIAAGLTPMDSLAALEDQTQHLTLRAVIQEIRRDIEHGDTLTSAFSRHPKVFPKLFLNMVSTGEVSGSLARVMERITNYLEKDLEMRRSIKGAFTYPKIVVSLAAMGIGYIMIFVVPAFQKIYSQLKNAVLPLPTRMLLTASDVIHNWWWAILAFTVVFSAAYAYFRFTKEGRPHYDRFMLNLPFLGRINVRVSVSRMMRTMGNMLACGVPLLTALEAVQMVVGNRIIEAEVERVVESVRNGGTISGPIRVSGEFPPIVGNMIAAGEHSGRLAELSEKCADMLDREIEYMIKKMLVSLEPMLTVFIAVVVGFIAIAVYLPIFNIVGGMAK